jgi:hypothetical protein
MEQAKRDVETEKDKESKNPRPRHRKDDWSIQNAEEKKKS